jgi:hypothetical protein
LSLLSFQTHIKILHPKLITNWKLKLFVIRYCLFDELVFHLKTVLAKLFSIPLYQVIQFRKGKQKFQTHEKSLVEISNYFQVSLSTSAFPTKFPSRRTITCFVLGSKEWPCVLGNCTPSSRNFFGCLEKSPFIIQFRLLTQECI